MAFGRENERDARRAEAWRDWLQRQHPFAVASFVLGVVSIIEFGLLLVFGIAGIVMGAVALVQIRAARPAAESDAQSRAAPAAREGHRLAWAGIILSALSLLLAGVIYSLPPAAGTEENPASAPVLTNPVSTRRV